MSFQCGGVPDWGTPSHSRREIKLTLLGTNESLTLPVEVTTKVGEVKSLLAKRIGVDTTAMKFVVKQASSCRVQLDMEEVGRVCLVKGLSSWVKEKTIYPHPMCIVGAGHFGLRQAMSFLKEGINDFTVYDRLDRVGGAAWVRNANPTSKLQTELGVYHLQYDPGYAAPSGLKTWPSRDELLQHFEHECTAFGITPHVILRTSVTGIVPVVNNQSLPFYAPERQHLEVKTQCCEGEGDVETEAEALFSTVSFFPGGLVSPVRVDYKGEECFAGTIGYGMFSEFDYNQVRDSFPVIIGFGAFAVENVRTCLEHGAARVTILCRRKNLSMPRVVSWLINQSFFPPSAALVLDSMRPMYSLLPVPEDPWGYASVMANADRTVCSIRQKSRFGIGDVFFLAAYYRKADVVVDMVKRLRPQEIVLESGEKLRADHLIKVLGFKGDFTVDRVLGIKEMVGYFVNGDWTRLVSAEFPGIDAGKFGGTSFSPKGLQDCEAMSWFVNYPRDLEPLFEARVLPRKRGDKTSSTPIHIWDPRGGSSVSMCLSSGLIPGLAELAAHYGFFNRERMLQMHPLESFVDECAEEWNDYCALFKEASDNRPFPPYPYTKEFVQELCDRNDHEGQTEMDKGVRQ